jgi:hypothetical protein
VYIEKKKKVDTRAFESAFKLHHLREDRRKGSV